MKDLTKSDGTSLRRVVWEEDGWMLRTCPTSPDSRSKVVVAFHRHKASYPPSNSVSYGRECQLNTMLSPGWVCRYCNRTAPEGLQGLFVMMNWDKL